MPNNRALIAARALNICLREGGGGGGHCTEISTNSSIASVAVVVISFVTYTQTWFVTIQILFYDFNLLGLLVKQLLLDARDNKEFW